MYDVLYTLPSNMNGNLSRVFDDCSCQEGNPPLLELQCCLPPGSYNPEEVIPAITLVADVKDVHLRI